MQIPVWALSKVHVLFNLIQVSVTINSITGQWNSRSVYVIAFPWLLSAGFNAVSVYFLKVTKNACCMGVCWQANHHFPLTMSRDLYGCHVAFHVRIPEIIFGNYFTLSLPNLIMLWYDMWYDGLLHCIGFVVGTTRSLAWKSRKWKTFR